MFDTKTIRGLFMALVAVLFMFAVAPANAQTESKDVFFRKMGNDYQFDVGNGSTDTFMRANGDKTVTFPNGGFRPVYRTVDYATTATARKITPEESGTMFVATATGDDPTTFTLPPASAGLIFIFADKNATAAADLVVDPATGDKVNNQTAGVSYNATGDAVGETIILFAIDDTNWFIMSKNGTWTTGT